MTPLQILQTEFEPQDLGAASSAARDALLSAYLARVDAERPVAPQGQRTAHARVLGLAQQIRVLRRGADSRRVGDTTISRDLLGRIAGLEREKAVAERDAGLTTEEWSRTRTVTAVVEGGF